MTTNVPSSGKSKRLDMGSTGAATEDFLESAKIGEEQVVSEGVEEQPQGERPIVPDNWGNHLL